MYEHLDTEGDEYNRPEFYDFKIVEAPDECAEQEQHAENDEGQTECHRAYAFCRHVICPPLRCRYSRCQARAFCA